MTRLSAAVALAAGLVACEHDEEPFEGQWWGVTCQGAPYGIRVYFAADERLDEAGRRREYLGNVVVDLDGTGLGDAYLWQVQVDSGDGTAETVALERAPFPADFADVWDVKPLELEALTFVDLGSSAQITGTCSWDGVSGDLLVQQVDDCDACIDCATVSGAMAAGPALILISALVTRRRRR